MTKLEQAEAIITKVEQMRKWQKEYFAHRDALALRKAKEIEKEIDALIDQYYGKREQHKDNQLNIFQLWMNN